MSSGAPCGVFFLGNSAFSVYEAMAAQLRSLGWTETRSPARLAVCDLVLGDRFDIPYAVLRCERLPSSSFYGGQRWVNYFRGSHHLTLKAASARLLCASDATSSEWMPLSFVIGGDQSRRVDDRVALLQRAARDAATVWIVKPSSGCKGTGIRLLRGAEVLAFVESLPPNGRALFVAQRYVDRPLLHEGRKFDVRVWALLRSPFDIFAFTQGSCRTASAAYVGEDRDNVLAHLTNHCLQIGADGFGAHEAGNEMWFAALNEHLRQGGGEAVLQRRIVPQMARIIVRTLLAARDTIEVARDEPFQCFQLFGYDLIVDEDMHVWLLEINGSPGIAERYLQPFVADMIALINGKNDQGGDAPRDWDIEAVRFVQLWADGDPIP